MLGKPLRGYSWQISEGSDSHHHTLIALSHCPRGVFCSEGLKCSNEVIHMWSHYRIWAKDYFLAFDAQTSLLCCRFIFM